MRAGMNKEQIAELFSAPAGDYAPGTDYLTRAWGWRRGGHGKVQQTLEWRSEKGRIVVEFDEKGNFVTSEFYHPGRDPVTNVVERLKWDRMKFDKAERSTSRIAWRRSEAREVAAPTTGGATGGRFPMNR